MAFIRTNPNIARNSSFLPRSFLIFVCLTILVAPVFAQPPDFHLVNRKVAIAPDGRTVVTIPENGRTPQLRDIDSGKTLRDFNGHQFRVHAAAFSPDGKKLITGDGSTVRLWDVQTGRELNSSTVRNGNLSSLAISADGRFTASGHSYGSGARRRPPIDLFLRDLATGETVTRTEIVWHRFIAQMAFPIWRCRFPECWREPGALIDLDDLSGEITHKAEIFEGQEHVNAVAFSPDSRRIICARGDGTARVIDVASGKELFSLTGHDGDVWSATFSPDGRMALTTGADGTASVWRIPTMPFLRQSAKLMYCFEGDGEIYSAAFSKNGRYVVFGGGDQTIRICDIQFGLEVMRSLPMESNPTNVAFSADDESIVCTCGSDEFWRWTIPAMAHRE